VGSACCGFMCVHTLSMTTILCFVMTNNELHVADDAHHHTEVFLVTVILSLMALYSQLPTDAVSTIYWSIGGAHLHKPSSALSFMTF
jgi:hypothetical protein